MLSPTLQSSLNYSSSVKLEYFIWFVFSSFRPKRSSALWEHSFYSILKHFTWYTILSTFSFPFQVNYWQKISLYSWHIVLISVYYNVCNDTPSTWHAFQLFAKGNLFFLFCYHYLTTFFPFIRHSGRAGSEWLMNFLPREIGWIFSPQIVSINYCSIFCCSTRRTGSVRIQFHISVILSWLFVQNQPFGFRIEIDSWNTQLQRQERLSRIDLIP